ncbi:hypothetical protein [Bacillus multifaciens]|nr:hypothetical protein [Bacillus sp. WLY-B-L8]MDP7980208.1 hypothetical protein [Bacillus sp. WLY-B-L8]
MKLLYKIFDERHIERYTKYHEKYHTYGVFELADGAVLRHHHEDE